MRRAEAGAAAFAAAADADAGAAGAVLAAAAAALGAEDAGCELQQALADGEHEGLSEWEGGGDEESAALDAVPDFEGDGGPCVGVGSVC